jgi:ribosome modulation factor
MNDHTTPAQQPPRLSPSPADLLGPRATLAAQEQGYAAALAGQDVLSCPWKAAATDRDVALRDMWIRGYAAGRTDLRAAREPE